MSSTLLDVHGIETFYGASQALFGVSLSVNEGEVITLIGRNGMGKSTTVNTLMGLLASRKGEVLLSGARVEKQPAYRIAQSGLALVPEGRQIFPNLTVRENLVATAGNRRHARDPWTLERVYRMFPRLEERSRNLGANLSGGEQQMLAIGRALLTNPRLLILDEATEGLAPLIRTEIWRCLSELKASGLALIVIDKNIGPLLRLADRHYILEKGRVAWSGTSSEMRAQPEVLHEYVGV
jgi:branched-chain amino acid transport system ATP-binding protein